MLAKFYGNVKLSKDAVIQTVNGRTFMAFCCEVTDKRGEKEETDCFNMYYFDEDSAKKIVVHLKKGTIINVKGEIAQKTYNDSATNKPVQYYEYVAKVIRFVTTGSARTCFLNFYGLLRLTKDAELKTSKNNKSFMTVDVAGNKTNSDGTQHASYYPLIDYLSNRAEKIAQYLTKGKLVLFEGYIRQSTWTDKNGNPRTSYNFVIDGFEFAGTKGGSENKAKPVKSENKPATAELPFDAYSEDFSDIPF